MTSDMTKARREPRLHLHPNNQRSVHVTSPAPREVWRKLLQHDPEVLPLQSPEWIDCICMLKGYEDASRLYEFSDGQQLLMPAVKRRGFPKFTSVQASLPDGWGWGGVISRYSLTTQDLAAVFEDLAKSPFITMSICPNPRRGELWRAALPAGVMAVPRRAHVLDLEGGFDRVWKDRFTPRVRQQIRRAEKSDVHVECDTTGKLVPVFYELYRRSVDRWAEQQHEPRWLARRRADPIAKVQQLAQTMGETCRIWVAWHEGLPVAASIVLLGFNADYIMGAMDKERAAPVYANALIQKLAIEDACRAGCHLYHMGESGASEGISKFKERFGAQAYTYNAYRLERFPISKINKGLKSVVKRAIGFKDAY